MVSSSRRRSKRRSSRSEKNSIWSFLFKLGAILSLLMVLSMVTAWLLWQQVRVPTELMGLVLLNENRQPHQVLVSHYLSQQQSLLVVGIPISPEETETSIQDQDFMSQITLLSGLPIQQVRQLTAPKITEAAQIKSMLMKHPPQSLSYWSQLKWQWLLQRDEIEVQLVDSVDDVSGTALVRRLKSNADFTCAVALVNTTSAPGLASQVATVLENGGWRVVQITNGPSEYEQSQIVYSDEACVDSAQAVSVLTPDQGVPQHNAGVTLQYRADVVVFLGKDFVAE